MAFTFNIKKTLSQIINEHLYTISLYARQASGTVVLLLIARYLSVYDYGLFSSYKNIATFCLMFANLGYADYILVSSKADVVMVKSKIAFFMLNALSIAIIIIFGSLLFKLDNNFLFILVAIRTFLDGVFFGLVLPYFQAAKKFNTIAIINMIYSAGVTLIAIISYLLKLSLLKFLLLSIILGLINFIQCSYYIKIKYSYVLMRIISCVKKYLDKSIFAFIGTTIAYFLYTQIAPLYVSIMLTKEEAALYFAAFTVSIVINLIVSAQFQKIVPELIKAKTEDVKRIIDKNALFILAVTTFIFILLIFIGKQVMLLFYGKSYYANAYPILLIFIASNIFLGVGAPHSAYLTSSGNQKKKIPMQLESSAIAIISLFALNKFGLIGVAFSYLITSIYVCLRYIIFVEKIIKKPLVRE